MTVTVTGQENDYPRIMTGLWTFDRLMSFKDHLGFPLRTVNELYGPAGHGKSTIAQFLAGKISQTGRVYLCDLETSVERTHMMATFEHAGYEGEVHMVDSIDKDKKPRTHESMLQETVDALWEDDVKAVIIDSLGMVTPLQERTNPLGAANMGKRAQLIAQTNRRLLNPLRNTEEAKVAFEVNHQYQAMGGRGYLTPGGDVKTYTAGNRISIWRKELMPDGSSFVECRTDKRRQGGVVKSQRGYIFIIPGYGVSPEMTAVIDCFVMGVATRKAVVKVLVGKKMVSAGRLGALIEKAAAGDTDSFAPFFEAISKLDATVEIPDEEAPEGETDEATDE